MPFRFNPEPDVNALGFFRNKGWRPAFDFRDVWKEEHLAAWTVAKAMELDVLAEIRTEVDRALEQGTTFSQFKRDLTPTLERLGWWGRQAREDPLTGEVRQVQLGSPRRLQIIYRTNLRTARATGQYTRVEQTQDTHPYLLYRLGPSRVHRPEHVKWDGLLLSARDPFWTTHYPPNGWGCRCRVRQVSETARAREGRSVDSAPPITRRTYTNERTGRTERVPEGIDPGWDYNPGNARLPRLREALDAKRQAVAKQFGIALPTPEPPETLR